MARLKKEEPAAVDLLYLCAFLAPEKIPQSLLAERRDTLPPSLRDAVADSLRWGDIVAALRSYSLAVVADESLTFHRLVQAATRDGLTAEQRDRAGPRGPFAFVSVAGPDADVGPRRLVRGTARAAARPGGRPGRGDPRSERSDHSLHPRPGPQVPSRSAAPMLMPSRSSSTPSPLLNRPSAPSIPTSPPLNNLAGLYRETAATPRPSRSSSGPRHRQEGPRPRASGHRHRASTTWRGCTNSAGRYAEAEPLFQRAHRDPREGPRPRAPGPRHRASTTSRSSTRAPAATPRPSRSSSAPSPSTRRPSAPCIPTLAICAQQPRHTLPTRPAVPPRPSRSSSAPSSSAKRPSASSIATSSAGSTTSPSLYPEDRPLRRGRAALPRAIVIREKTLGPEHPNLAVRLNNLATLYRDTGRYAEAEPLFQRAMTIGDKSLPPDHPALGDGPRELRHSSRQARPQ